VEGEPIFKYVERTTESYTSQAIFFPAHKDFCMDILDNLDQWLRRKFNGVETIFAFRLDPTAPLHTSKNEQLTSNNIICTVIQPQTKCSRTCNPIFQGSFNCRIVFNRQSIPNEPMGQIVTTCSDHIKHDKNIKDKSQLFSFYAS
jgi:hypothetical protein